MGRGETSGGGNRSRRRSSGSNSTPTMYSFLLLLVSIVCFFVGEIIAKVGESFSSHHLNTFFPHSKLPPISWRSRRRRPSRRRRTSKNRSYTRNRRTFHRCSCCLTRPTSRLLRSYNRKRIIFRGGFCIFESERTCIFERACVSEGGCVFEGERAFSRGYHWSFVLFSSW